MSQDLRELFKEETSKKFKMKEGHEDRFRNLLDESFPEQKRTYYPKWSIAAAVLIMLGTGIYFFNNQKPEEPVNTTVVEKADPVEEQKGISLGDLSPDLKKIEDYYVANINLELSQLEVSTDNKGLVDSYLERLAELNKEYERLNHELNTIGPNDQTITALIQNLQLRLELLHKLKVKLNELKSSKNEQVTANIT